MHRTQQHRPVVGLAVLALAVSLTACSRQTAEEKGAALASEKIDLVKGVGAALEAKGSAAAESLAGGLGKVVEGAEKGFQKSGRSLEVAPSLEAAGLAVTHVQDIAPGTSGDGGEPLHGLEVYVVAQKAVQGQLRVVALDALGREIGRTRVALQQDADAAGYQTLPFDKRVNLPRISTLSLDFQPEAAAPTAAKS